MEGKVGDIGDDLEISVIPAGNPLLLPPFLPGYLGAVSEKKMGVIGHEHPGIIASFQYL